MPAATVALAAGAALADPPDVSPRPVPRNAMTAAQAQPDLHQVVVPVGVLVAVMADGERGVPQPEPRPSVPPEAVAVAVPVAVPQIAFPEAPRPEARPTGFLKNMLPGGANTAPAKGAVCGVRTIRGTELADIGNPARGCGIDDPVKVTEVAGVSLSTSVTIDCPTARALNSWVEKGLKPAIGRRGGGVVELTIFASYACRSRNNIPGGKLSEHGRGHAVDVGGLTLKDGTKVTVLDHWRSRKYGAPLRKAHAAACGPFGTVLGPKADKYHRNHFHLDTAQYRSGPFCQ